MTSPSLPKLAEWILRRAIADVATRESILGDMSEEFTARAAGRRRVAHSLRCIHAALWTALPYAWERVRRTLRGGGKPHQQDLALTSGAGLGRITKNLLQDLHFGLRALARRPGFTSVAVLTLALGVGTNTAIFSAVHSVLLKRLPFDDPERLVVVFGTSHQVGQLRDVVSGPNFLDFKERNRTFDTMAAFKGEGGALLIDDVPVPTGGMLVSPDYFAVLGLEPALGRLLKPEDGTGPTDVAVISHRLWQQEYGGDPDIVGRRIRRIDRTHTVIGVLPPGSEPAWNSDLVVPLDLEALRRRSRTSIDYWIIGRLRPGVTPAQAEHDLNGILREIARDDRRMEPWSVTVAPLQDTLFEYARAPLLIMLGAVGLTFLIACANVANLLLTRGVARAREMAIRVSLGAGRRRIAAQLMTEASILGMAGGALGVISSLWLVSLLRSLLPSVIPIPHSAARVMVPDFGLSPAVLLFGIGVSLAAVMLFGLIPAAQVSRTDLAGVLRAAAGKASASKRMGRMQRAIVAAELALAGLLLTTTGVALRSTMRLLDVDPGLEPSSTLTMYVGELQRVGDAERARYYTRVLDAVAAVPGVTSAGLNDYVPFQGEDDFEGLHVEGRPIPDPSWRVEWRRVSADYLDAVGLRLIRGRWFTDTDDHRAPSVVVINEAMAKRYWPNEDPIGLRVVVHEDAYGSSEIVGIVSDVRRRGLDQEAPPVMYVPYHRKPRPVVGLFVRTAGDPARLADAVKAAVWSVDRHQPIEGVRALDDIVAESTTIQQVVLQLVVIVALLAVTLATVGVYGVMSYWIGNRVKEMSIRMALGAGRGEVVRGVFRAGVSLALVGLPLGLGLGALVTRAISGQLYGVDGGDPLPYLLAAVVVLGVALVACLVPARRATRIDPIEALRVE